MEEISVIQQVIRKQISIFQSLLKFTQEMDRDESLSAPNGSSHRVNSGPVQQYDPGSHSRSTYNSVNNTREISYSSIDRGEESYSYPRRSSIDRDQDRSYSHRRQAAYYDDTPDYFAAADPMIGFKLEPTDPGGYRVLLLNECLGLLGGRREDFSGFKGWAANLERVVGISLNLLLT